MDHLLVGLVVAALIALAAYYVRVITSTIRAGTRPSPRPSYLRTLRTSLSTMLIGLALATPIVLIAPPDLVGATPAQPDTATVTTVECTLHDRDPDLVARAIMTNSPDLFNHLAATCHTLPDGPLSEPCELMPPLDRDIPALPACFTRTPSAKLFVFDPLASDQTKEWTLLSIEGKAIDTFHIHRAKRAELLVIALPETGSYTYALNTDSFSDKPWCPDYQKMRGDGEIAVRSRSLFVVSGTSCSGTTVWLESWMPELN